jgi:RHS repeat-associated protein
VPEPASNNWNTLLYRYDAAGRRIEKQYNWETITKYVYDGDHCIAEYDVSNILRRKYIYGPCTDEPICMIEFAAAYAGTYYYHFDALGSVVALTDDEGDTVQVYEYDVYGRVGAIDASHPNRLLFTGREYDKETGLYYYRARYYNPQIGRFLQTDPVGYDAGMNLYTYCKNDPVGLGDPYGLEEADPWGGLNNAPEGTWFEFEKATGRVLILPKNLDPGELQMCNDFASFIGRWRKVVKRIPGAPKIPKKAIDYYLQGLEDVTKALPGIAGLDKSAWRAFIEVNTYDATKGKNGWVVRTISKNNWVEVVCLGGWAEELGGYESYGAAVQAAQTGIKWFNDTHRGIYKGGVVPTPPASIFYDDVTHNMFWGHWRYTGRAPSMGDYLTSIGE